MGESAVSLQGVCKSFGRVRAVDGLDLLVPAGQTVALLGPNGAGKSTTVSLLLGLLTPDAGRVQVLGGRPEAAVAAGAIAGMLQDGGLMPGVGVAAVVGLACRLYPHSRPVGEVLELAGLGGLERRRVDRLSGGQMQRVRFAMAIAGNPAVLLLDEPTAALDVEARRALWSAIREYAGAGRSVLFATHYLQEADENADRVVVVARGRIVADAPPARIRSMAGGRTVRFSLAGRPAAGLDHLPGVTAVDLRGPTATLHTTDAEATVRALLAARDRVPDLEVTGAALEDAVLALTS